MLRLITLPLSHYCEKVRWALQRQGIEFREEGHAPGLHVLYTLPASKRRSRQVPILVDGDRLALGSTECLRQLHDHHGATWLYASPGAAELEVELDTELGPPSRLLFYFHTLPHPKVIAALLTQRIPVAEAVLLRLLLPLLRRLMRRTMKIDAATASAAHAQLTQTFARIGERLKDGRPYLCGDVFSAADLSFAALAAPLLLPTEYGGVGPQKASLPKALRDAIDDFRATPAGAFALRLYQTERRHLVPPRRAP